MLHSNHTDEELSEWMEYAIRSSRELAMTEAEKERDREALAFVGICQSCGRYLDVRQHERCPAPCHGYIG